MSEFVNTVDIVGDEALATSIIDRTITEISDDRITSIEDYGFYRCSKLTTVDFSAVTAIDSSAFGYCSSLTKVDFSVARWIGGKVFTQCSKLTSLILRNTEKVCTLTNSSAFSSTPIASGKGYIYVPKALVDSYKAASDWSTYADQIRAIEDYPLICDPYTWPAVFSALDAGTYKDYYKVGDCIPLDLGSEGIVNMQIAAFDADDLADGSGKAKISWVAHTLHKKSKRMNPKLESTADESGATVYIEGTGAVGGWEKSEMRNTHIPALAAMIPENIRARVVKVKKTQGSCDTSGVYVSQTTEDEYFIPSQAEIRNGGIYTSCYPDEASCTKKMQAGAGFIMYYWLRDTSNTYSKGGNANCWCAVSNIDGSLSSRENDNVYAIALSFCM